MIEEACPSRFLCIDRSIREEGNTLQDCVNRDFILERKKKKERKNGGKDETISNHGKIQVS